MSEVWGHGLGINQNTANSNLQGLLGLGAGGETAQEWTSGPLGEWGLATVHHKTRRPVIRMQF